MLLVRRFLRPCSCWCPLIFQIFLVLLWTLLLLASVLLLAEDPAVVGIPVIVGVLAVAGVLLCASVPEDIIVLVFAPGSFFQSMTKNNFLLLTRKVNS